MTTSNSLEGEAYDWYLWWSGKCNVCSFQWKNFVAALLKIFYDEEEDDLYNKFNHLKQKGNVNDYTHEWKVLVTRHDEFTAKQLLKMYICGLKYYIRSEVKLWKPKTIEDARYAAKLIEQKNRYNRLSVTGTEKSNKYLNERTNRVSTNYSNKYVPPHLREDKNRNHDNDKKWENKCRRCGEKWSPGHRCINKKLYTCQAEKESDIASSVSDFDIEDKEENDAPITNSEEPMPKISLAAITRIAQPQTLKLKGYVKKENVTVLIDTGSTHNFIDINVAKRLNLFVYPTTNIKLMVADGKKIDGVVKCHKVKLQISDYNLESGFYTVPLGGVDIVLGIQWLQTLGTYSANHQKQFIKFKWEGRRYKLYGLQPPPT